MATVTSIDFHWSSFFSIDDFEEIFVMKSNSITGTSFEIEVSSLATRRVQVEETILFVFYQNRSIRQKKTFLKHRDRHFSSIFIRYFTARHQSELSTRALG